MKQAHPQDTVREQAAAWVIRLQADPSAVDQERFHAWRAQSPLHEESYKLALEAWESVGEHAASPRLLAMRRDALERARRSTTRPGRWDRRAVAAALSFAILTPILMFGWYRMRAPEELEFQTGRGEQRVIVLEDGSRMSMDAMSRVKVSYTADVRGIELAAGRANFEVAKDVTRPLKVHAGPRTVTAVGTVFTVEREPQAIVVTLVEGRVAVTTLGKSSNPVEMQPRQQLQMQDSGEITLREGVDTTQALAWREGKLIFDNEPLERVAARMNNYSTTPLVVEGAASDLRVSGVFKAGDTTAFVDAMENYFSLTAARQEDAITIRASR